MITLEISLKLLLGFVSFVLYSEILLFLYQTANPVFLPLFETSRIVVFV
jgi:hypothetical protein